MKLDDSEASELSWYPIRDIIDALASLAPKSTVVHDEILKIVAMANGFLESDESGVLDFHRTVRSVFERLDNREEMYQRALRLGMPRHDPYGEEDVEEDAPSHVLPDFPDESQVSAPASIDPLNEAVESEIRELIPQGARLIGVHESATAYDMAESTDQWLRRLRREGRSISEADLQAVGLLFGHAVACVTQWKWCLYRWQGTTEIALSSSDTAHVHLPVSFIRRLVVERCEVTALLTFNLLAALDLPDARPGALRIFG